MQKETSVYRYGYTTEDDEYKTSNKNPNTTSRRKSSPYHAPVIKDSTTMYQGKNPIAIMIVIDATNVFILIMKSVYTTTQYEKKSTRIVHRHA
jgi:hypothetical protein